MMRKTILVLVTTLALAACETAEEMRARHDGYCQSFGFTPGTTAFAQCLQKSYADEQAAMQRAVNSIQQSHPTHCTTNYIGNTAYTNCF